MTGFVRQRPDVPAVELATVPIPSVDTGEVLVEIHAFGVGIHDRWFIPSDAHFPYVIGTEGAGTVTKTGGNDTGVLAGERVMLSTGLNPKGGTWAQYAVVPQGALLRVPTHLDLTRAAAIPIAGKTALECMATLNLTEGDTLFVAGASGAIGTLVVQLATGRGVRVAGSASLPNLEYLRSLGAEVAVDYSKRDWPDLIRAWVPRGTDAALAIQPGTGPTSLHVVRDGGQLVTVSGDQVAPARGVSVRQVAHHEDTWQGVAQLASEIASGKVQAVLERIYDFKDALSALEKTETRHARGKLVVAVHP